MWAMWAQSKYGSWRPRRGAKIRIQHFLAPPTKITNMKYEWFYTLLQTRRFLLRVPRRRVKSLSFSTTSLSSSPPSGQPNTVSVRFRPNIFGQNWFGFRCFGNLQFRWFGRNRLFGRKSKFRPKVTVSGTCDSLKLHVKTGIFGRNSQFWPN